MDNSFGTILRGDMVAVDPYYGTRFEEIRSASARLSDFHAMASWEGGSSSRKKISPQEYFKGIKDAFVEIKITPTKVEEDAAKKAESNGQKLLAEKIKSMLGMRLFEKKLSDLGIKYWINGNKLQEFKHSIKNGHISDTPFENYTRLIPDDVITQKKKVEAQFDMLVIYHYWDESKVNGMAMSDEEYQAMKDPILFGVSKKNPSKYYVIADWEDEYCNLTFDKVVEALAGKLTDFELK